MAELCNVLTSALHSEGRLPAALIHKAPAPRIALPAPRAAALARAPSEDDREMAFSACLRACLAPTAAQATWMRPHGDTD